MCNVMKTSFLKQINVLKYDNSRIVMFAILKKLEKE